MKAVIRGVLVFALLAAHSLTGNAAAGRIDFTVGDVKALSPDGRSRPLTKGAEVANGETIDTGNGRAQLRFTDGAQVSLAPNSQFRIDDYHFSGKADGSEKGFFSLLKGAVRTITGVVGRSNRSHYKMSTTVATIGIRGTEYSVAYGNSISVTTGEGIIEICNIAGCLILNSSESAHVADANTLPVMTDRKTEIPPVPLQHAQLPGYIAGDDLRNDGTPSWLTPAVEPELVSGPGYSIAMEAVFNGTSAGWQANGLGGSTNATFANGGLAVFSDGPLEVTQGTPVGMLTDGVMGWGRWIDGSRTIGGYPLDTFQHTHYVIGTPTPLADMNALQIANITATYALTGYTYPTAWNGSTFSAMGTLPVSGSLTANFGTGNLSGNLAVPIGGNNYTTSWSGTMSTPYTITHFAGSGTVAGGGCTGCSSYINGFFAGPNASHAGLTYRFTSIPTLGTIQGAAVFKQ